MELDDAGQWQASFGGSGQIDRPAAGAQMLTQRLALDGEQQIVAACRFRQAQLVAHLCRLGGLPVIARQQGETDQTGIRRVLRGAHRSAQRFARCLSRRGVWVACICP